VKIYYGFDQVTHIQNAVVTTGSFDGVHLGHQLILRKLQELAKKENGESVVITFYPHPRKVLYPNTKGKALLMINTQDEKIELLEKSGLDHLIFVKFTKEFANTSAAEFVEEYLIKKLNTSKIVTGKNHHFGRNRDGDIEELKLLGDKHHFGVELIPLQDIQNVDVSSTLIRESIIRGKIKTANTYLTHDYFIIGKLAKGSAMYKRMGYQTYWVEVSDKYKLVPPCGSYSIHIRYGASMYPGIALISTCGNSMAETALDIYFKPKNITLDFDRKIGVFFLEELNIQDKDKKGSLLNSIMMKDLIRFDNNA
jgi:riboflavin kinase/FMN adenylyltransferase